jgi:uncharacterized protein YjgD (DUF1641 family)
MSAAMIEPAAQPTNGSSADKLVEMNLKLDLLTQSVQMLAGQVQWLTEKAEGDRRRQQEWDELREDAMPILNEAYATVVQEMSELDPYVHLEDVQELFWRLARNTRNINRALDMLESGFELARDVAPLSNEMVVGAVEALDQFERKGYFGFARQGMYVLDQVVTSFSEEDVRQLGDNVVLILNTVKALTQPEVMTLVNNLTQGFHAAEEHVSEQPVTMLGLLRQMRDPDVRRGLAITLETLRRVSQQSPRPAAQP